MNLFATTPTPNQWRSHAPLLVLAAIILFALAIRLQSFGGYVGTDDAEYAHFAHQIVEGSFRLGDYEGPAVFPLRIGVIAPTAALFGSFGRNEWTMVLYPLLLSLAGIVLVYACASHLFGQPAGWIAAALTAVFPWDIDGATKLLPDLPAAFFAAAGVTTIILVEGRGAHRRPQLFAAGLLAGLAFGLSWLCKETIAYLAPFCIVWFVLHLRKHGRPFLFLWGGVAVASLAILVGEMLTYQALTGDLLFRVHETDRNYAQWQNGFFSEGSDFGWQPGTSYREALLDRLFVSGPTVIFFSRTFLFLPLVALPVTVYAWLRRDRAYLVPTLWFWTLMLMFNFSSSSAQSYLPLPLFHRYLSPAFFPLIVLVAGFLATTIFAARDGRAVPRTSMARWGGLVAAAFIGYVSASELWLRYSNPPTWLSEIRALKDRMPPDTVVYSDALSLRALQFFHDFPTRTAWTDLREVSSPNDIPGGGLVLVFPAGIQWLDKNAGMWVKWPEPGTTDIHGYLRGHWYSRPPASWTTVWQRGDVVLYRVGDEGDGNPSVSAFR